MIRKIEGYNAWICYKNDIDVLLTVNSCSLLCYNLPLFSTNPGYPKNPHNIETDLVLCVECKGFVSHSFFENFVEKVNKTWNKFYESKH